MTTAPSESTDRAAQGVRRSEAAAMSAVGSARTRTLGGETVEFKAVDYRAPEGARSAVRVGRRLPRSLLRWWSWSLPGATC